MNNIRIDDMTLRARGILLVCGIVGGLLLARLTACLLVNLGHVAIMSTLQAFMFGGAFLVGVFSGIFLGKELVLRFLPVAWFISLPRTLPRSGILPALPGIHARRIRSRSSRSLAHHKETKRKRGAQRETAGILRVSVHAFFSCRFGLGVPLRDSKRNLWNHRGSKWFFFVVSSGNDHIFNSACRPTFWPRSFGLDSWFKEKEIKKFHPSDEVPWALAFSQPGLFL